MRKTKPFDISKQVVWEAYKRVKANRGVAGVDGQSIDEFERGLYYNLYKLWNRMSSGSYFPPPVRTVEIPKSGGGKRKLGIPTVMDRIAQMVVKLNMEPEVEKHFHPSSYGYRPEKSAVEAVGVAKRRCWQYDWVLDLDIKGFFDAIDHELMMRAVRKHTSCKWMLLYVERWLKAPAQSSNGTVVTRERGTPQGGVISPLLANLFLHYVYDQWMERNNGGIPFERYADDVICHCKSEAQAKWLRTCIERRMKQCGLELHPGKTKIVYCKDDKRRGSYPHEQFDFLGFTFRPRRSKNRWGVCFTNFSPAVSNEAAKKMRQTMRRWRLHLCSGSTLEDLARKVNPIIGGWINYYGSYYKSALYPIVEHFNLALTRWVRRKYKKLRVQRRRAWQWLRRVAMQQPGMFAHWRFLPQPLAGQ